MELLQENMKDQRHGWTIKKKVKWHKLQVKRDQQINMQLIEELKKLEQMMNYWADPDQRDNVKSCIFVADNCDVITGFTEEDAQYCEAVKSMEDNLSGDKYSEEESSDAFLP